MASTRPKTKTTKRRKITRKRVTVKQGDLVLVTWMDACADIGWNDHKSSELAPAHCKSIGWVGAAKDPEDYLMLYADKAHDDQKDPDSNRRIAIPTGWITSIKKVRA